MPQNKEDLDKLLLFISEIANEPNNEWFKAKLVTKIFEKQVVELDKSGSFDTIIADNIESIRRYLMLDVMPIIDYSDILDNRIRDQLYRDCIEMSKYRLGKINNCINFDEFCRYAHLQAEELLNYFYYRYHSGNITDISSFVKTYIKYEPKKAAESLNHIDYSSKLNAYKNFANLLNTTKSTLEFLNTLRNELSHRNSFELENEEMILSQFSQLGFAPNKYVNIQSLDVNSKSIFFKGKHITTKRLQDYNSIYEALNDFKISVVTQLRMKTQFT